MKKLFPILACAVAMMVSCKQDTNTTEDEGIVLHYDFSAVEGITVKDLGPNHVDAQLMNGATVEDGNLVLFADDAYLDMTAKAGEVMQTLEDFSISATYCIDSSAVIEGYGFFLWCFSKLEANQEKEGPYQAYRINEQRCETSIGGWSQETGIQKSQISELGRWINVTFRQQNGKGELFIDGKLIGTEEGFPVLKEIFTEAPAYNWMGRAPFNGDKYLSKTRISDFRVYNRAVTDEEVASFVKDAPVRLYVSCYGSADTECISIYDFDPQTAETQYICGTSGISNPSFLCLADDGAHLYAVGEDDGETASANALVFNPQQKTLRVLNSVPTHGGAPCNIIISPEKKEVITANYVGGSISVFPIDKKQMLEEGRLVQFEGKGVNADRQEQPHLHAVNFTPDGQLMLANDLGTDRIHIFRQEAGASVIANEYTDLKLNDGAGPRHLCFSPCGNIAYLLSELSGEIFVMRYDASKADEPLSIVQTLKADTIDAGGSADIHVSPDGKFLYASHRLQGDGFSIYTIAEDGTLTRAGYQQTGIHPRNFAISPDGRFLLVACRDSNVVQIFARDMKTGLLSDTGKTIQKDKPVCVIFAS